MIGRLCAALAAIALMAMAPAAAAVNVKPSNGTIIFAVAPDGSIQPLNVDANGNVIINASGSETVDGYQQIASATLASATAPTIPGTAKYIDVVAEGVDGTDATTGGPNGCVRWRDDGTSPTGDIGLPLRAGTSLFGWTGSLANLKFILATGATCTLNLRFWH